MTDNAEFKHIDGLGSFGLQASRLMLKGFHALKRRGQVVWVGPIGAPIEDADCDCIVMHPDDFDRCVATLSKAQSNGVEP